MENDLKIIKKKYGEKMMHYCREELSIILEKNGLLSKLLLDHFNESHILYDDIVKEDKLNEFKNYIYSLIDVENNMKIDINKTPYELLSEAGYNLYECKTEEDIQSFKRFYSKGEELCTFRGNRLEKCYVFFAVKKDVEKIKREDFLNPKRQDEYGTSVISIQFTKKDNTLSIKNRYNHTVNNPDATFSNNLDNIIEGLTQSFNKYYGFNVKSKSSNFELENYVYVADKFYKYNYEINNIYYCLDNIVIDNFEVKKYDKEKYILFDYFLLDLKEKKLYSNINDSFVDTIVDINKINIVKKESEKEIHLIPNNGEEIIITLDNQNRIIKYINNNILECGYDFLRRNEVLQEIELPNLVECGYSFLYHNEVLQKIELPKLKECDNEMIKTKISSKEKVLTQKR